MARPECVAFGLSLASYSSELMNARTTSLESSSARVNGITFIFILVTFIRFTAVSAYPVTILCQCTGISQYWLASYETTLLLQALPFLSHFCCSSNAASARVGLSTCFVLEHVYPFKLCYIFAPLKPRIILIRFIFCLPTFLCRFFFSLFPRCHVLI